MSGTYEYPAEVVLAAAEEQHLIAARVGAVRDFCVDQIDHDAGKAGSGLTDRAWCAQGVLNILNGLIDDQLQLAAVPE